MESDNIRYLYSLDISMKCTGICIFDIDTYKPILVTHIETEDKDTHGDRLHMQREFIRELMDKYPPHEVAIERGFSRFNNATQVIFRAHGVLNELLHKCLQVYYPPKTIKEVVGKNGNATKKVVQNNILKKYPEIEFANEDESDAVATGICHLVKKYKMKW